MLATLLAPPAHAAAGTAGPRHRHVLLLHSLAGGTGSGGSSRIIRLLREHPRFRGAGAAAPWIWDVAVAPFAGGETALQAYNAVLALGTAVGGADLVTLVENDAVYGIVQRELQGASLLSSYSCSGLLPTY